MPILIALGWQAATGMALFTPAILPSMDRVFKSFVEMAASGQLAEDVLVSLSRVVKGYVVAVALGVVMGTFMGMSDFLHNFFSLTLNAIRQIPILAWIPLIILWFGIGEESKIAVIVLGAYFPVLVNTISGIRQTPQGYVEVARLYRLSRWTVFRKVYLPSALPQIFVGMKLGLGISWVAVVASELIAASAGIGFRISDARSLMQADVVIVGMIVIGVLGLLMDKALSLVFHKATPWTR
nr:ABC transporter permease [Anaerotalea alkaliphila]